MKILKNQEIQVTTVSPKGQVVIPQEIRKEMEIKSGTKFAVYGRTDVIIFKRLELPTVNDFENLVDFGKKFAKKRGIKKEDVLKDD
ncbi:MAG: AbrB family transcriptional regulator [Candidatus Aenigmarchaeota archaeon]|nr:AbrB family transcriptional regulator [Candidatus Aenigmarchaeota archaeon]